jgi:hypothetical protein
MEQLEYLPAAGGNKFIQIISKVFEFMKST